MSTPLSSSSNGASWAAVRVTNVCVMRVVVVGASSGLGRCIAVGLGQRDARVALLARRRERLEAAATEAGDGSVVVECDVTDQSSVRTAIEKAAAELGGIDGLV